MFLFLSWVRVIFLFCGCIFRTGSFVSLSEQDAESPLLLLCCGLWRSWVYFTRLYINLVSLVDTFNVQLLGQILFSQFDCRRFPPSLTWRGKKSCDNNVITGKCFFLFFYRKTFYPLTWSTAESGWQLTWVLGPLLWLPTDAIIMERGTKLPSSEIKSKVSVRTDGQNALVGMEIFPKLAVFVFSLAFWVFLNDILFKSPCFLWNSEHRDSQLGEGIFCLSVVSKCIGLPW